VDGTVTRLTAQEGDMINVGDPLGYVDSTSDEGIGDLDDLLGPPS
jgi:multidrug efflux pump subunit AcrA (membrane-fusion protein)